MTNQKVIYSYLDIYFNVGGSFFKCIGGHGSPGSVKYFVGKYYSLYIIYKGLKIISAPVKDQFSVHLGGNHIN